MEGTEIGAGERLESFAARDRFKINIPGICRNCSLAHIYRTPSMNEPVVLCQEISSASGQRVPVNILECNKFSQIGALSIWQLSQLCLDIDISKPVKHVGFGK